MTKVLHDIFLCAVFRVALHFLEDLVILCRPIGDVPTAGEAKVVINGLGDTVTSGFQLFECSAGIFSQHMVYVEEDLSGEDAVHGHRLQVVGIHHDSKASCETVFSWYLYLAAGQFGELWQKFHEHDEIIFVLLLLRLLEPVFASRIVNAEMSVLHGRY